MDLLHHLFLNASSSRVLVLAAHGDDEVIGCGGLIARMVAGGARTLVHFACMADRVRAEEAAVACRTLGTEIDSETLPDRELWLGQHRSALFRRYCDLIREFRPHLVLTHHPTNDGNPDHKALGNAALEALEFATHGTNGWTGTQVVLGYEIHALFPFPSTIVDVTGVWETVIKAMMAYRSQIEAPHKAGYYLEYMDARSRLRGVQGGFARGEAYHLLSATVLGNFNRRPAADGEA
ncbi:MAG: PIG-L deacetylase family protein [Planctomycetota bacterium]